MPVNCTAQSESLPAKKMSFMNRYKVNTKKATATAAPPVLDPSQVPGFEDYRKHVFTGKLADKHLKKQGSSLSILNFPSWVKDRADTVAAAVLDW